MLFVCDLGDKVVESELAAIRVVVSRTHIDHTLACFLLPDHENVVKLLLLVRPHSLVQSGLTQVDLCTEASLDQILVDLFGVVCVLVCDRDYYDLAGREPERPLSTCVLGQHRNESFN